GLLAGQPATFGQVPEDDRPAAVLGEGELTHERQGNGAPSGGAPALAVDPPALLLRGPTPDALLLAALQGELEAGLPPRALLAHRLRDVRVLVALRVENRRVQSAAGRV